MPKKEKTKIDINAKFDFAEMLGLSKKRATELVIYMKGKLDSKKLNVVLKELREEITDPNELFFLTFNVGREYGQKLERFNFLQMIGPMASLLL